ncbi:hypothetical protein BV20DRAFT_960719 [Pilatotrama ljubarskyi]|nr:hypothetical protein BV20DRAFT_960719 [Pilatotrama ljubarskyi]
MVPAVQAALLAVAALVAVIVMLPPLVPEVAVEELLLAAIVTLPVAVVAFMAVLWRMLLIAAVLEAEVGVLALLAVEDVLLVRDGLDIAPLLLILVLLMVKLPLASAVLLTKLSPFTLRGSIEVVAHAFSV